MHPGTVPTRPGRLGGGFDDPVAESVLAAEVLEEQFAAGAPNLVLLTRLTGADDEVVDRSATSCAPRRRPVLDLLTETGSEEAVSVRAVAQRVGVSAPSIYLHFVDKRALIDAVCKEVFEALHQRMRAAAAGASDPFVALRA